MYDFCITENLRMAAWCILFCFSAIFRALSLQVDVFFAPASSACCLCRRATGGSRGSGLQIAPDTHSLDYHMVFYDPDDTPTPILLVHSLADYVKAS